MHELSIAQNILEAASRQARDRGFQRILSIHLRVGKLSGIEVESLRFCFKVLSEETIAQSAGLEVEMVPLRGRCRCCQSEFAMEEVDFVCPRCHNRDIELISGTEMLMDKMEVE
ncbi:MAG: hydrogenase maturation nickel metallochaperone HypA [bacterium]|jgi:hydrogenase nickel incorporation protein HypA/HybF